MHISLSLSLAEIYTPFIALLLIYSFGYCSLFISLPHILCLFVSFNLISHQFSDGCTYPIIHIESYSTTILRSLSLYTNTQCFPTSDQFNIKLLPCTIAPSLLLLMMIFFSLQSSTKCIQFFCAAFHSQIIVRLYLPCYRFNITFDFEKRDDRYLSLCDFKCGEFQIICTPFIYFVVYFGWILSQSLSLPLFYHNYCHFIHRLCPLTIERNIFPQLMCLSTIRPPPEYAIFCRCMAVVIRPLFVHPRISSVTWRVFIWLLKYSSLNTQLGNEKYCIHISECEPFFLLLKTLINHFSCRRISIWWSLTAKRITER